MPAMRRGRPALGKVGQRAGDAPRPRGRGSNRGWGADPLTPFPPWAGESESTRMEPQLTPPRCLLVPPTPHGPADPRGRGPTERTSRPSANRGPDRNPGLHCVVATPPLCPERSHPPRGAAKPGPPASQGPPMHPTRVPLGTSMLCPDSLAAPRPRSAPRALGPLDSARSWTRDPQLGGAGSARVLEGRRHPQPWGPQGQCRHVPASPSPPPPHPPNPRLQAASGWVVPGACGLFFPLNLQNRAWVSVRALPKGDCEFLQREFNTCQRVYKCALVKPRPPFFRGGGRRRGLRGAGAVPEARKKKNTSYLLERHPQGAHVHVGRHPARVQVAGRA